MRLAAVPPESEEFAVYNAVIQKAFIRPGTRQVVISDETEIDRFDRKKSNVAERTTSIMKAFAAWRIEPETVANYFAANKFSSRLQNQFTLSVPAVLLTQKEREKLSY
jgi:hypothetical protein